MTYLGLKWGTLKSWDFRGDEKAESLFKEYSDIGMSWGCMQQQDTPRQKEIICELIDLCDDPKGIYLDWDGVYVTKDEAKKYVLEYGKEE